jgi:hypothetical protein
MAAAPTVVSAYYPLPNMYDHQTYLKWIEQFWPKMACNLVWFTVPPLVRLFERLFKRKTNVKVLGLPMEQFDAYTVLNPLLWTLAKEREPEKESELYALLYEKKAFVRRAMDLNPFGSETFVWCDPGICRTPTWVPAVNTHFPIEAHIPRGRMLLLQIEGFEDQDTKSGVGCSILASDRAGWNAWSRAYDRVLMRHILADRVYGSDEMIAASMVLERPELAIRLFPPPYLGGYERTAYFLFFLGGVAVRQA